MHTDDYAAVLWRSHRESSSSELSDTTLNASMWVQKIGRCIQAPPGSLVSVCCVVTLFTVLSLWRTLSHEPLALNRTSPVSQVNVG